MNLSVGVILPTLDREDLLPCALDSLLSQDHPDVKILALDGGSADGTQRVLAEYAKRYPDRLAWEAHPATGLVDRINMGMAALRTDLVTIFGSDDEMRPGALSALAGALARSPDAVVASADFELVDGEGALIGTLRPGAFDVVESVRLHDPRIGGAFLWRRSAQQAVGPWDVELPYACDFDFWIRLSFVGAFVHVPSTLARVRDHPGRVSAGRGEHLAAQRVALVRKLYARPDVPPELEAVRTEAFRAAYVQASFIVGPPGGLTERYVVADRLWPRLLPELAQDLQAQAVEKEALLHHVTAEVHRKDEELVRAQDALQDLHAEMRRLHQEIAVRDDRIATLEAGGLRQPE